MPEIPVKQALNKAFIKVRPERAAIELFKSNFITLLDAIKGNQGETEEFLKNLVSDFLKNTWYSPHYFINTSGRIDLVIHTGRDTANPVGVIIEAKKPGNKNEMISRENINGKAIQELLLYYLRERITNNNLEIKHLIITNTVEWFIFDAQEFEKYFTSNKKLLDLFRDFEQGSLLAKDTAFFYTQIAAPAIEEKKKEIQYTWFSITDYEKILRNSDKDEDNKLISLFKLLSPYHLLKLPFENDSNTLNQNFYAELLYILGLSEEKEGGKKIIIRNKADQRKEGSLLENTIFQLSDFISGEEKLFETSIELIITWINRILFLKLLESQQVKYQKGSSDYAFLNIERIKNYTDLNTLFFKVLAVEPEGRPEAINKKYKNIPYLNSSLFDMTETEKTYFPIANLQEASIDIFSSTVLKGSGGAKRKGPINTLQYIFEFLNAYDFSSEGSEEIQEENKSLINASVLGLIFEKINGYKDGSYFTPGFITTYICCQTIQQVVIDKFNAIKGWQAASLDDLYNEIKDIKEANRIINSITICDPAVGSGHFLVSALNEIIAIKSNLGILSDDKGRKLKGYTVDVVNDELMIFDEDHSFFAYNYKNDESRRIQKTIFQEKQRIIENSLFGVDINPNSVKICRLRLWIELLKNAYYTDESGFSELETLPNIDINIKCGNSLISRFDLDIDLKAELKKLKFSVKDYQEAVYNYKNAAGKEEKNKLEKLITEIKNNFRAEIKNQDKLQVRRRNLLGELDALKSQGEMFEIAGEAEKKEKRIKQLTEEIAKIELAFDEYENNKIYDNAFEWRFEFPEVLTDEGDFTGFDAVIGNPPYGAIFENNELAFLQLALPITNKLNDSYFYFIERAFFLLKMNSLLSFIIPNTWLLNLTAREFRKHIFKNHDLLNIVHCTEKIFPEAVVDTEIVIFNNNFTAKNNIRIDIYDKERNIYSKYINQDALVFLDGAAFNVYEKDEYLSIKNKANIFPNLDSVCKITQGTKPFQVGKGKPPQTRKIVDEKPYVSNKKIDEFFTPLLRGSMMNRYQISWNNDYWIKLGDWLAEPRYSAEYEKVKIIIRQTGDSLIAAYDDKKFIVRDNLYTIVNKPKIEISLKYILALLNSKFMNWYYQNIINNEKGEALAQVKRGHLAILPIPGDNNQNNITCIVDAILTMKEKDTNADISKLESELDKIVYELFNLTDEEVAIVEGVRDEMENNHEL
jgi:hypothetical protein